MSSRIEPEALLGCYRAGIYPMAESRHSDRVFLVDPAHRGILPLDGFRVPSRLARTIRSDRFDVRIDQDFRAIMRACAEATPDRRETWINDDILAVYAELHDRGFAHSVECRQGDALVGGLYGVSLGAAFFGESMFSRVADASKVALVHLVGRLIVGGYQLLDTQDYTDHIAQFGALRVTRAEFRKRLTRALKGAGDFFKLPEEVTGAQLLQSMAQTS